MAQVDFDKALNKYYQIASQGNTNDTEKAKYNLLWETSDFLELIVNYIFLDTIGLVFDFGKKLIPKGTKLYRIRYYTPDIEYSNASQWTAPPSRPQNRANTKGQEALYLGSTETVCLLETHIKNGEKYVLGVYEVTKDIEVGGFLSCNPENELHNNAGMVLNAFLIAPARGDKNKELFDYLDTNYGKLQVGNLADMSDIKERGAIELPLKFGVLNQLDEYYNLTNMICNILSKYTPSGIRYSSCYIPLETIGIECSDYNVALYNDGISKVKFIDFDVKTNTKDYNITELIKGFSKIRYNA